MTDLLNELKNKLNALNNGEIKDNQTNGEIKNIKTTEANLIKIGRCINTGRGGKRLGAGRKPKQSTLISGVIDKLTEVSASKGLELALTDTKTGKTVMIKNPKVLVIVQGSTS